ncbi:MAG: Crp/Fnr family transcriptional regulator [Nitrobacter sp. 62-13]|uniref:Crp/Fnr family transcriptional regulator n=1 Tax=Nitrobacter sp. 62-13 TaxID=1895797 RepID=UPI00095FA163|nr:Crp/Fnr family transcriptional regulator [Nitrobacter sp. 62-13]OJU29852.1 MAG: Crp/Fnr family transcriptional regulator [Nitrobacter sp. 62-13]
MDNVHQTLVNKLKEHSKLTADDMTGIETINYAVRHLGPNEDLIRQGDTTKASALVLHGMLARYHLMPNGRRQYLSYHLKGDVPDAQMLFIEKMDHGLCAMDHAMVASIPHSELMRVFHARPTIGFAVWRETLIDSAIFREAITNNSARSTLARLAHFFCELFYRAKASGLTRRNTLDVPIGLNQLGETLAMSLATVNRALLNLRETNAANFKGGELTVFDWAALQDLGEFDPSYLHIVRKPRF